MKKAPYIPHAPRSIQKGSSLKMLLDREAIEALAHNISFIHKDFDKQKFIHSALLSIEPLGLLERGHYLAEKLRNYLPSQFDEAINILLKSLTPPLTQTSDVGLGVFFYLPHVCFVAKYGLDKTLNGGKDPFEISMNAQYELTRRFSAEFSMRPFLIHEQERTLKRLLEWTSDPDAHVRRLCSEGTRPRLPWAIRIPSFIHDPTPTLAILDALKDDPELYVQRSVANHLGDIAKDHPEIVFELCERWLAKASESRKWLIRHALRHPAKKGNKTALKLRKLAK